MTGLDIETTTRFKQNVLLNFEKLLPIFSNPGKEQDMFFYVKRMFGDLGFVDQGLPLLRTEYQIHHKIGGDGAVYARQVPNLGLSYNGDPEQPTYFFNAHLDHYFVSGITEKMLYDGEWLISDGKNILAADCKMGIALIYAWVTRMLSWEKVPNIDILFDTCEEPGLVGMNEFVEERLYVDMPFYKKYQAGKQVLAYSVDGGWTSEIGDRNYCYLTRPGALALSQYLCNNEQNKVCVVEGNKIRWRNLKKRDKALIASLHEVGQGVDVANIEVLRFGASFVLLNKVMPCVLLPVGFEKHHTSQERYWLPYLNIHEKKFDKSE